MSRLTPFSRMLIGLALLITFFLGMRNCPRSKEHPKPPPVPTDTVPKISPPNTSGSLPVVTKKFNYLPPEPIDGKMKGVVELGATGFGSFIVNVDYQKNWKLAKADYGSSLLYENLTTDFEVNRQLKNYISEMLAYGVNGKDIHFVISSGAQKVPMTKKIIAELKKLRYFVNVVTTEQEGELALKCVLPQKYENIAFVVDIGSGTTKIAWKQGKSITAKGISFGAKYPKDQISDEIAYQTVSDTSKLIPNTNNETCFIIGGIPFELAKQSRKEKERYTVLKTPKDYKADGEKQKAGINIYKAIADATGCKEFVFDWDANFTIGFLLSLPY